MTRADTVATDDIIARLVRDLRPVRRLAPPALRAATWLSGLAVLALIVGSTGNLQAAWIRQTATPDMAWSVVGSVLTLMTATLAAFTASVPGRSRLWWFLPMPAVALWLGASGAGCLRTGLDLLSIHRATLFEALRECLPFIIGMSVPLALTLGWMLRRARPLNPGPVTVLGGLASASGAASLLWLVHPFDVSAVDIAVHVLAVLAVVGAARAMAKRLAPEFSLDGAAPA